MVRFDWITRRVVKQASNGCIALKKRPVQSQVRRKSRHLIANLLKDQKCKCKFGITASTMASTACTRSLCLNPAFNGLHQQTVDKQCRAKKQIAAAECLSGCPLGAPRFGGLRNASWRTTSCSRQSVRGSVQMSATVAPAEPEEPKVEEATIPIEKQGDCHELVIVMTSHLLSNVQHGLNA